MSDFCLILFVNRYQLLFIFHLLKSNFCIIFSSRGSSRNMASVDETFWGWRPGSKPFSPNSKTAIILWTRDVVSLKTMLAYFERHFDFERCHLGFCRRHVYCKLITDDRSSWLDESGWKRLNNLNIMDYKCRITFKWRSWCAIVWCMVLTVDISMCCSRLRFEFDFRKSLIATMF